MNLRVIPVALLMMWALGYLPLGFAPRAQATICSLNVGHFKGDNTKKVTFSHAGCTLGEIIAFSKSQTSVSQRVFEQLLTRSLRGSTILTAPCEMPGCRPCQGGSGGKCEMQDRLPDTVVVVSISTPASKRAARPRPTTPPAPPAPPAAPPTAPLTDEEKSFLSKYGVTKYAPSLEEPPVSLVLFDQGGNIFEREWVDQMSQAGYLIAALYASPDAFELPGKSLGKAYDVLIRGIDDKDPLLERALVDRRMILQSILQEATESLATAAAELATASEEIRIAFNVHASQLQGEFATTRRDLAQLRSQAESSGGAVRDLAIVITSQKSRAQKSAEQTTADLHRLRQGLLTDDAIRQSKSRLTRRFQDQSPSEIAAWISGLQGQMASSSSPALREQYENILRTVTDQRGLVTAAAITLGLASDLKLETEETSSVGRAVRQNLNEALLVLTRGAAKTDVSYAVTAAFLADQAFASQKTTLGNRYLNRARSLLDFATGHQRVASYRTLQQNPSAIERFGALPPATSYTSYQTRKTSNALGDVPITAFSDDTYILSQAAIRQMVGLQNTADALDRFHQALDVADTVLDFSTGVGAGMLTAGRETATGLIDAVLHPIDTAKGFAQAVLHLDILFDAAVRSAVQVVNEFPEYSAEKKGEVVGEIGFHVASTWFSMGLGKAGATATDLARAGRVEALAQSLEKVVSSAKKIGMSKADDFEAWAKATATLPESRLEQIAHHSKRIVPGPEVQSISPDVIKFSQSSVSNVEELVNSMRSIGWPDSAGAIDVVKMADGTLVTIDNTRNLAASRAGINVKAIVHAANEAIAPNRAVNLKGRNGNIPQTWEQAAKNRISNQNKAYRQSYPNGSYFTGSVR